MRLLCASSLVIIALSVQVHGFDFASFFSGIKSNDTISTDAYPVSSNQSVTTVTITPSSKTVTSGSTINNLPSPSDEKVVWVGEATLTPVANNTQSSAAPSNFNFSSYASFLKSLLPEVSSRISDSYLQGQQLSSSRDSAESSGCPLLSVVNPPNVLRKALRRPSWMSSCRKCSTSPCSCRSHEKKSDDVDSFSTLADHASLSCTAEKKAFITPTVVLTESIEPPVEVSTCYKLSTVTLPFVTRVEKVETEVLTTSVPVTVNQTYLLTSSCPYITHTLSTHTEVKNVMVTSYSTKVHTKCTPFCYLSKTTTSTLVNVTVKTTMSYVDTLTSTYKKTITHSEWLPDCSSQHGSATPASPVCNSGQSRKRGSESTEADVVIMGKPKIFISPDMESDVVEDTECDVVSKSTLSTTANTANTAATSPSTKCPEETSTEMVTERVTETITQTETSVTTQNQTVTHTSVSTHSHTVTHTASGSSAITSSPSSKERGTTSTSTSSIAPSSRGEFTSSTTKPVSSSIGSASQVSDNVSISDTQSIATSAGQASDSSSSSEASQTFTFNPSSAATTQAHFVPISSSGSVTYGATVVIQCDDSGEPTSSSTSTVAITNLGTTTICNCTCCNSSAPISYVDEDKMNQISKQKAKDEVKSKNTTSVVSTTNTTSLLGTNGTRSNDTRLNATTDASGSRSKVSNTTSTTGKLLNATSTTGPGKGLNATSATATGKLLNATTPSTTGAGKGLNATATTGSGAATGKELNATSTTGTFGKSAIGATATTTGKDASTTASSTISGGLGQVASTTGTAAATGTSGKNAVGSTAATAAGPSGSTSATATKAPPSGSGSAAASAPGSVEKPAS